MKGALARRARRRAISVLPTPVGPIMSMFLGVISWRSGSSTCCRRQRLRNAMATARLARSCPTMCLSSSWTISCGVMWDIDDIETLVAAEAAAVLFQHFDGVLLIGVNAQVAGDGQRLLHDGLRVELGVVEQRPRGGERVRAA